MSDFSDFLREKLKGMTLKEVCAQMKRGGYSLDMSILSRWRTGHRSPGVDHRNTLLCLADVLRLTEDEKNELLYLCGLSAVRSQHVTVGPSAAPARVEGRPQGGIARPEKEGTPQQAEVTQAVPKEVIPEIRELAEMIEQLTCVPSPEKNLIPDDKQPGDKVVRPSIESDIHDLKTRLLVWKTPWWRASGPVEIRRHLGWEQQALLDRFLALPTSQRFKAALSDWELRVNRYLSLKQSNAAMGEINAAYQVALQAERNLKGELWKAVEAIRWGK